MPSAAEPAPFHEKKSLGTNMENGPFLGGRARALVSLLSNIRIFLETVRMPGGFVFHEASSLFARHAFQTHRTSPIALLPA